MTTEQNKAIVRRFYEAFSANDPVALRAVLSPDLVAYSHGSPDPQDRETHLQGISGWNNSFSTDFNVEEQIAEGDKVATRTTLRAVFDGDDFMGVAPTGKEAVGEGMSIEVIKDGKIVARRTSSDWLDLMRQLGLSQQPEATG